MSAMMSQGSGMHGGHARQHAIIAYDHDEVNVPDSGLLMLYIST